MKLSSRARYAVRLVLEIDRQGGRTKPVQLIQVSNLTGISKRYLEQLAIALKSHSLIRGISGRKGGYMLAQKPTEISIGQVLKAVIGPIDLSVCVVEPETCMRAEFCECRLIWTLLNRKVNAVLEEFSIADLSDKKMMSAVREHLLGESREESSKEACSMEASSHLEPELPGGDC